MVLVEGITKKYGKKTILEDVSFRLSVGEQVAIIGRNGSGKTTLMHIMAGIIKPDEGSVSYFGHDISVEKDAIEKFCGYLPQENPLMEELNVQDNISLWSGRGGRPDEKLIEFMELESILKEPVKNLSGGMKRRAAIACTIVNWPPVLLMDEPTNGLDIYYKHELRDFMKRYRKINGILLIVTHDEEEMRECNRCFEMDAGRLKEVEYELSL